MIRKNKLIVIIGPTASGKTELAIDLATRSGGQIVSADSRQIYAGLNIGTAKPKEAWREDAHPIDQADRIDGIPHWLINIATIDQKLALAQWQKSAYQSIDQINQTGAVPLLVGGTMLYIDSILYDFEIPQVAPDERQRRQWEQLPTLELYEKMRRLDPAAAVFVEPNNKRRIIRALEVMKATGKPWSRSRKKNPPRYEIELIGLFPGWTALKKRIIQRTEMMWSENLLAETENLSKQYPASPLLETMNYKQARLVLAGQMTRAEAKNEMGKVMYRYARRQMGWWRGREIKWFDSIESAKQ